LTRISLYENSVIPLWKEYEGAQNLSLVVDRTSGKGISIAWWASEEAAKAFETSGDYETVMGQFASLFSGPPSGREFFEVVVDA
jgi:heme-degrading monooxygenase HmoA